MAREAGPDAAAAVAARAPAGEALAVDIDRTVYVCAQTRRRMRQRTRSQPASQTAASVVQPTTMR